MNEEKEDFKPESDKSVFNSALAQLQRINNILNFILSKFMIKDFSGWFDGLNCLSREVSYLFKKDESEKDITFQNTIEPLIEEFNYNIYFNERLQQFILRENVEDYSENYSKLYGLLIEYEKFLKNCLDKRKMLGAKADSPEFALES